MDVRYLCYNLFKTDYKKVGRYVSELRKEKGVSAFSIWKDMLACLFRYDTYLLDYFYFRFFDLSSHVEREKHTNIWDMYLFQKKYNKAEDRHVFRDKIAFREVFKDYFNYPAVVLKEERDIPQVISFMKDKGMERIVAKDPLGTVGNGVRVLDITRSGEDLLLKCCRGGKEIEEKAQNVLAEFYKEGFVLFESFIEQHAVLKELNPSTINTIRVVTFVNDAGAVEIWGTLLRIGVRGTVDNFHAGGLSAKIDERTGVVVSPAQVMDPFDTNKYVVHPVSHKAIEGVRIPYWTQVLSMVREAALKVGTVRTVGWDIAITPAGPTFIEGNDNWDKTIFELITGAYLGEKIKSLL